MSSSSRLRRAWLPKPCERPWKGAVDVSQRGLHGADRVRPKRGAGPELCGGRFAIVVKPTRQRRQRRVSQLVAAPGLAGETGPIGVVEVGVAEAAHDRVVWLALERGERVLEAAAQVQLAYQPARTTRPPT
jgi:hypothetical protein